MSEKDNENEISKNVTNEPENIDIVLLATAYTDTEALLFEGILRENDIPYLRKDKGTGEVMGIIMGFSMLGSDFYVERSRFDEAAQLLEAYASPTDENADDDLNNMDTDSWTDDEEDE